MGACVGWIVILTAAWMLLLSLLHLVCGRVFRRFLDNAARDVAASAAEQTQPAKPPSKKAAVLLPMRGADPFLDRTLQALAAQSFPDYQVIIIVDHVSDPAWEACQAFLQQHADADRFTLQELQHRRTTCSLKCSSLIQAVQQLGDDVEWVVLTDADVVPHETWLQELVTPLLDPGVGLSTGQQWFVPSRPTLGSVVRSVWNSGAIVPTVLLGHPWAGSTAMRRVDMLRSGLLDDWSRSIVDDGPMATALHRIGLKVQFVPSVIMLNREQTTVRFCWSYLRRMLTWSRLFESTYPLTVFHATLLQGSVLWTLGLALAMILQSVNGSAFCLLLSVLVFWLANLVAYYDIRRAVRRHSHDRRLAWPPVTLVGCAITCVAIPLTHLIYAISSWRAYLVREVKWREITYRIDRAGKVQMVDYRPFATQQVPQEAEMSL